MISFLISDLGLLSMQVLHFFSSMDPAYMDILKIFAGSIGWVGGLTIYMWLREKRRNPSFQTIE
jgi:hypothetical protein